ncbi:uncharacterized protein si:busm1-163l24.3 [Heptranchias perlo]|uniref:uncharacterized protein si:busm1-163l24.3 n=1 Tax=Heptranchias perlo TaxID=212740 RepID=UPI00355AC044
MDRTIQVSDLPAGISKRSLEDKLMIHFLRRKNGGGEIIEIVFSSESPSAHIIFEKTEVAQRVLRIESHVLAINGKHHKLKVEPACTEIKADQVILHVSMIIDYGKLPGGKRLMKHLQRTHKDVQFSFDQKAEQCTVGGIFSVIQELSGEIHHLLSLTPDQSSDSYETELQPHDGLQNSPLGSSNSIRKVVRKSNADSNAKGEDLELQTKTGMQSLAHGSVRRDTDLKQGSEPHTGNFEDYTLLMDSDIYVYIQKFHKDRYQEILHQYLVEVLDITSEDITTLILQAASDSLGRTSLLQAHQELSKLYQDFEVRLRKEQINKKDLTYDIKLLQNIYARLQVQFPKINFNEDENHFYLIGTSNDCSLAKKYLQDLKEELAIRSQKGKHATSSRHSESHQASASSISQSLQEFDGNNLFNQVGCPKTDARKDHKLAPTFSGLREKSSTLKAENRLVEDDLVLNPVQTHAAAELLTGHNIKNSPLMDTKYQLSSEIQQKSWLSTTGNEMFTSDDKALTSGRGEFVVPNKTEEDTLFKTYKDFTVSSGRTKELKSPDKTDDDILFKGYEGFSIVGTNKGDKLFQYPKSNKANGPIKPYHFETSAGTLFHHGDLLGNTQTLQSVTTTKSSEGQTSKPSLRRTSSFSEYLKSKHSRDFGNSFQGASTKVSPAEKVHITEELPIDSVVWSYLKDIYDSAIRNISTKNEVAVNEQMQGDITIVKLTAFNKANITAAKQDILSLYTSVIKHLTQQFLSYTDLGIEDYTEKTLEQWSNNLKSIFPEVKFITSQAGFYVVATNEHCLKVIETFKPKLKDTFLEALPSTGTASISASNRCSFLGTEKFKDTEGEERGGSTEHSSLLGQVSHGRKPNGFHTPVHHMDDTSKPKKPAKTREEHPSSQPDRDLIESMGHRKVTGNSKKNCNSQPDVEEEGPMNLKKYSNENDGPASWQEHNPLMDQKRSPKPFDEYSGLESLHDQADYKSQKMIKQIGDVEGVKAKKALPDKFHFTTNKLMKESHWYDKEGSLHRNKVDNGTQSLPIFSYPRTSVLQQNRGGPHAYESATNSRDQMQEKDVQQQVESSEAMSQERKAMKNSQQNQPRSPAVGLDAQELNKLTTSCNSCKKSTSFLQKVDCGHFLCNECYTINQSFCPACCQSADSIKNESQRLGSMKCAVLNVALTGFSKDLTLKITYDIPDGVQRKCDPSPGQPFEGGQFTAFLPDNPTGRKILQLLVEAFDRGLTFRIVSAPSGRHKVEWNEIPHKTATNGAKFRNGFPDAGYLKHVLAVLKKHGLQ